MEDLRGNTLEEKLHFAWDVLQIDVNNLMDNDMDKAANRLKIPPGLKQVKHYNKFAFIMLTPTILWFQGKYVNF